MRDALAMVRAEFGDGAAVLHSREVNAGRLARLVRGRSVEVAATPDRSPLAEQAAANGAVATSAKVARLLEPADSRLGESSHAGAPSARVDEPPPKQNDPSLVEYGRLIEADVAPGLAKQLVAEAKQTGSTQSEGVQASLAMRLRIGGPIRIDRSGCRVVALVGPTGVGKTTTLAKLAANFRLQEGARVGLVTVDTYRVAAVDQLRTYAEIIDLPMEVVSTPAEMTAAIEKLADRDLILIDTAGRSPRDGVHLEELRQMLAAASPDETHLVASLTTTARSLRETIERFAAVGPTSLLLTKLDESPSLGHAAEPILASQLPISYLTDGQSVPEDIRTAHPASFAAQMLTGGQQ